MLAAALEAEVDAYVLGRSTMTRMVGGWWSAMVTPRPVKSSPERARWRR